MVLNETSRLCICEVLWILILNLTIDFMLGCHSNSKLIKSVNWKIADSKVESKTCCCCCAVSPKCWTVRINFVFEGGSTLVQEEDLSVICRLTNFLRRTYFWQYLFLLFSPGNTLKYLAFANWNLSFCRHTFFFRTPPQTRSFLFGYFVWIYFR